MHAGGFFPYLSRTIAESLIRCTYEKGPLEIYTLEPNKDSKNELLAFRDSVLLECRLTKLSGIIDSSLFSAFSKIGANIAESPWPLRIYLHPG